MHPAEDWVSLQTYCRGTDLNGPQHEDMVCCKSSDNPSDCEDRNWAQNEVNQTSTHYGHKHVPCLLFCC